MSLKINPPILGENFERYKQDLEIWKIVTNVEKKKQGTAIALTLQLPDDHPSGIKGKVFKEIKLAELEKDTGLGCLIKFMSNYLGKDDTTN